MPRDNDLHKAAYKGDFGGVEAALQEDEADVNGYGAANRTALHRAVAGSHPQIVKLLLNAGATVDILVSVFFL
jgi:ankyrin repeat protein